MGLLRTLFALTVVLYHSWPGTVVFLGGENAVRCFYVISGFLISYILIERRSYPSIGVFYLSRYLRLYPVYIFVALLSLIALLAMHERSFIHVYESAPAGAIALLVFANLFMFGQDWVMFLGVRDHALELVANFNHSDVLLYQGQLIHPSWTLGIELSFYLIAPFVLPRRKLVLALLGGSVLLRLYLLHLGLGARDPWSYRFFPTELALFLAGALAHQVLLPRYRRLENLAALANAATLLLITLSVVYFLIPVAPALKTLLLLGLFVLLVPLTFVFQDRHRFDGWIGELSYPIYIGHMLVLWVSGFVLKRLGVADPHALSMVCVILTVAFAWVLNRFIAVPVERLRHRLRGRILTRSAVLVQARGT